jgi:hypothetical protein
MAMHTRAGLLAIRARWVLPRSDIGIETAGYQMGMEGLRRYRIFFSERTCVRVKAFVVPIGLSLIAQVNDM